MLNTNKKIIFCVTAGILLAAISIAFFLGHPKEGRGPFQLREEDEFSQHDFVLKSAEDSARMMDRAVEAFKKKNAKEAIEDCRIATDILPINANPYILLTKYYLMTGQEEEMFRTLTHAGHSFPDFDKIVSTIDDADLDKIPLEEPRDNIYLANFPENKKMAISFMFDDGEADVYKVLPTFEKYGYRATIPVIAGFVADTSKNPFWGSWAQWRDAANRGFEIANHSMYHTDMKTLKESDLSGSIDLPQKLIEKNTGYKVTAYVFPYDSYSDEDISYALRSHEAVRVRKFLLSFYNRTVKIVYGGPFVSVETANRLVDIGIKRRLWLLAECHGVREESSAQTFKSMTPVFLDKHLAYIHSRSEDVWVDTFSNVFEYLSFRKQTTIETKSSSADSMDFVLHHDKSAVIVSVPLTVIVKTSKRAASVQSASGHALKAWSCAMDKLCIDVDSYDENIHVQWAK